MSFLQDHPLALFAITMALLWIASLLGAHFSKRCADPQSADDKYLDLVLGATFTLLGLIIGFTFSMAASRYDQRKNYEEQEANAIGTEYVRLDVLPAADGPKVRTLLRDYLDLRIIYYTTRDAEVLRQTTVKTSQLQSRLWSTATIPATTQPTPATALVLSGMNDVLNSEGYTEAAWANRVPGAAWILLMFIAVSCNFLFGYRVHGNASLLRLVMPIALSVSFYLIAEIDSPRSGLLRVRAQNLERLAGSLR